MNHQTPKYASRRIHFYDYLLRATPPHDFEKKNIFLLVRKIGLDNKMSVVRRGYQCRVEECLIELGYARVLSWLISTYLPTIAEEVRSKFENVQWPRFSVEQVSADEELFAIDYRSWFSEFASLYRRLVMPSSDRNCSLMRIATRLETMLQMVSPSMVNYLTPDVDLSCTKLRILICDSEAITLSFDIPMTADQAYRRFNQRLTLFLSDIRDFVAPRYSLLNGYSADLATVLSFESGGSIFSRKPHNALSRLLQLIKPFVDTRNAKLFCAYDREKQDNNRDELQDFQLWKEWVYVEALWKFASPHTKEAVWRALEDLLDLSQEIDQVSS